VLKSFLRTPVPDLANFNSGHFADIAPGFELRNKSVETLVVVGSSPELVPETIERAQAVELIKSRPGFPREHSFVTNVLVDFRAKFIRRRSVSTGR
jgi:hypothetical protein